MNPQTFLDELSVIANAPGGVQRLREMILFLGLKGRLTEQLTTDSSAVELLDEVKAYNSEQLRLRGKKVRSLSVKSKIFLTLPPNWVQVKNMDLFSLLKGKNPKDLSETKKKYPYQDIEALDRGNVRRFTNDEKAFKCHDEDILVVCDGSRSGLILQGKFGVVGSTLAIIQTPPFIQPFVKLIFQQGFQKLNSSMKGAAIPHLDTKTLLNGEVGLPPIEEQKRIVAKVDQLMALCDQLEGQQQKRSVLIKNARTSTLEALAKAQGGNELFTAWKRAEENIPRLLELPEDVEELKSAIKDVALNGNLIPIDKKLVFNGEDLLRQIESARKEWEANSEGQELKEARIMMKKLKKQKLNYPKVKIPDHWVWASFLQISKAVVDCHNKTAPYVDSGIHLVRTSDIRNGFMNLQFTKKITTETYDFWARRMPPISGDIFFTREAPMGEAAIVPKGATVCLGQRTMLIRLFPNLFEKNFLIYAIYSPNFIKRMMKVAVGAMVKHLRVGDAESLMVPVPPLIEQKKIVEKIQALLSICDILQKKIKKSRQISKLLAQSMVESITGISMEKQEKMKAPKTELITKLKLVKKPDTKDNAPLSAILAQNNDELSAKALWNHSGLPIDEFYYQLKIEMVNSWIEEPEKAEVRIVEA
ncbi:MAG: restriction endonuclease subunit S [Proteobacteria bacterium]|nr:restriction endonuclease subunit S [Pseudomonadota bacterium]MBU1387131.1 restriction endonuclease subunit S [Pseudomonadota bacterium]MBU1541552.1 restriction endonuclease subunit S [Pseudomonadota bacterium]